MLMRLTGHQVGHARGKDGSRLNTHNVFQLHDDDWCRHTANHGFAWDRSVVVGCRGSSLLGALPHIKSAMLSSLPSNMPTYGRANVFGKTSLATDRCREAINEMLLYFGLTTAFLFAVFQRVWQSEW